MLSRRNVLAAAALLPGCAGAPPRALPMSTGDAMGDLDAVGLATRIADNSVSARAAADAAISRAGRVNPQLNFLATSLSDAARARADTSPRGPLGGVPTLIKDLTPLAGAPTHYGSRAFANAPTETTNPPYVQALLDGGVVPIGKSATPEFGLSATTEPLLGGAVKNPWDVTRSAGGSSGGSAAAVAAGVVPIAHGNDGGGSLRIPAACCGLVGLKISRGRAIGAPDTAPVSLGVEGCLTRTVRDTAAWFAMTERQGASATFPPIGVVARAGTRRLRIGVAIRDIAGEEPDPEIRAAIEAAAALCRRLDHQVRDITPPLDGAAFRDAFILYWASSAAQMRAQVAHNAPANVPIDRLLEPLTIGLADYAANAGEPALGRAIETLRATGPAYASMFSQIDVLLTPTLAKPPPPLGELGPLLPWQMGLRRLTDYVRYTPIANAAGAPAMTLPLATGTGGLPIGVEFAAAPGQERTLLELAYELEAAQPWISRRPRVWAAP